VIHVQSRTRLNNRMMGVYPENQPGEDFWNESSIFTSFERNKAALTLDLGTPAGRDAFLRLVTTADIVMENNRPGVMERLGLGDAVLAAANPRLIAVHCSGYGHSGPYRDAGAFARTIDAMSGLTDLTGYLNGEPLRANPSFMDMLGAWNNACAALLGLLERGRTGVGLSLDVSMYGTGVSAVGTALLARQLGASPERLGNRRLDLAPQGVYPCKGHDRWIAVSVRDDDEWQRLAAAIGEPWAAAESHQHLRGRLAAHDHIDEQLAVWTAKQDRFDLEQRLQSLGLAAAVVRDARDIVTDEHLQARGFFQWVRTSSRRPAYVTPYPGLPLHLNGYEPGDGATVPLGADNERLLHELGYDAAAIAALCCQGVIGDRPVEGVLQRPGPANFVELMKTGAVARVDEDYERRIAALRGGRG